MKIKMLLAALFVAGFAAALAFAAPIHAGDGTTATTTTNATTTSSSGKDHGKKAGKKSDSAETTTTARKVRCQNVELKGTATGSLALTVTKANHGGAALVGKQVTLAIPAGATVGASACVDAAGVLTLRNLKVAKPDSAPPATTAAATTSK